MKILILFLLLACANVNYCEHLIIGESANKALLHQTIAEYTGIPFMKREKNVFYSSPAERVISGIVALDKLHSKATAEVTAGGVGQTFVNLKLESERGKGLDYDIGIYS